MSETPEPKDAPPPPPPEAPAGTTLSARVKAGLDAHETRELVDRILYAARQNDDFGILGLNKNSYEIDVAEIKARFKYIAKKLRPDTPANHNKDEEEAFKAANNAYHTLLNLAGPKASRLFCPAMVSQRNTVGGGSGSGSTATINIRTRYPSSGGHQTSLL